MSISLVKSKPKIQVQLIGDAVMIRTRSKFANGMIALSESAKRQMDIKDMYVEVAGLPELDPNGKPWRFNVGDQIILADTAMIPVPEMGDDHWIITCKAIIGVIHPLPDPVEAESVN